LFQSGFGIGFFLASFVWLFVGANGPGAWRIMYLIGVLPALLTLWIRWSIPESQLWQRANERRKAARRSWAKAPDASEDSTLTRFTLAGLFADPELASGQFTWMSAWLPELFPTQLRATGVGFIFNAPRVLAAIGVLIAGTLIVRFGGYGNAAMIVADDLYSRIDCRALFAGDARHAAPGID
jgi:MFS family permease